MKRKVGTDSTNVCPEDRFLLPDVSAEKRLWSQHLLTAIRELYGMTCVNSAERRKKSRITEDAEKWFEDDSYHTGSFRYVCDILGLEPELVRHRLKEHKEQIIEQLRYVRLTNGLEL